MFETLKKTLLASLGAIAFNKDKLQQLIDDLVARGELTREQGMKLFDTLINRGQVESEEISSKIYSEVQSLRDFFPVSRKDFLRLEARVEALEQETHAQAGAGSGAAAGPEPSPAADAAATPGSAAAGSLPLEYPGEALPPREGGATS